MAGFRGAAPPGWQPGAGRTCVCYGARVPTPAGKLGFLVFEPTRRDLKDPSDCRASHPSLQTVQWRKQGSGWPGARGFVVDPQIMERGRSQGDPSPRTKTQAPPGPKVAGPQRRWLGRRWTPIPGALGAPGGLRAPSLPKRYASLLPGVAPGLRRGPRLPTHSACWRRGSCGCSPCTHPGRPAAGSLC